LEKVFGRHTAVIEDDFRVYWAQAGDSPLIAEVLARRMRSPGRWAAGRGSWSRRWGE
jgi:hypothetical protein